MALLAVCVCVCVVNNHSAARCRAPNAPILVCCLVMSTRKRVCVCVLGDYGHSPRMQSHSLSLASNGFVVDVVAYSESKPHGRILANENIIIHPMLSYGDHKLAFLPRVFDYAFKVIFQAIVLFWTLIWLPRPNHFLVQNPPAVPVLPVVWLMCMIKRSDYVIDWHNYGWTILNLSIPPKPNGQLHPLVSLYRKTELYFGAKAAHDLCVSNSMSQDLQNLIGKKPIVLYDKPYMFYFLTDDERHNFWMKMKSEHPLLGGKDGETLFTEMNAASGHAQLKTNRPALIVSSTSWTIDEDFQILLDALQMFDGKAGDLIRNQQDLKIVCIITGKGPMKQYYFDKLNNLTFKHTKFIFPWLPAEDYPKLLACADVGVSLHKSSSGLDLPMKVVDMLGSGLPVCAFSYRSIGELVVENTNGLLFENHLQLTERFTSLLDSFPSSKLLNRFRLNITKDVNRIDWASNWNHVVRPVFAPRPLPLS